MGDKPVSYTHLDVYKRQVIENYDYLVEICEKVRKKNNSKYNDLIRKYNEINNQYEELCRDKTES